MPSTSAANVPRYSLFVLFVTAMLGLTPECGNAQAVGPGSSLIDPTRIRFGTVEYTLTLVRGDEEESVGMVRDEIMPIRTNDPVLRRVLVLIRAGSTVIDTTWSDLETLAPLWHKSVQPKRTIELEFKGTRVRGVIAPNDTGATSIDTTLTAGAFDSSNWDLIARALPLENGEATLLSMYDVERKGHRYNVRVVDRQVRGKTDVIHVIVELGGGREAHAWFDDKTRVLLRVETQLGPDTVMRQVLKANP